MPVPSPTPNLSIPDVLKDPVLLGQILVRLETSEAKLISETKRADDNARSRDEWRGIADKEKLRADTAVVAANAFKQEATELRLSTGFLRQSVTEYKTELTDTRRDLERANASKKWYLIGGGVAGMGVCLAARRASP